MNDRKRYYDDATSWALDRRARDNRSVRTAWTVAGVLGGIAMLEAVALALLTPLKTVQPVTLLVDRQTGFVQALDPQTPRRIQADAALTNSMLAHYVAAREGFDRATISADYRNVALWSSGVARRQYLAAIPESNPDSPFHRYPAGSIVDVRVKSVSPLAAGAALVRFDTTRQDRSGGSAPAQPWISIVRYRYSDAGMSFDNRLANPLGFQVTSYRRDPEAPLPTPAETAAATPVHAPTAAPTAYAMAGVVTAAPDYRAMLGRRGLSPTQIPTGSPLAPPR